jgi:hypothetical protein
MMREAISQNGRVAAQAGRALFMLANCVSQYEKWMGEHGGKPGYDAKIFPAFIDTADASLPWPRRH